MFDNGQSARFAAAVEAATPCDEQAARNYAARLSAEGWHSVYVTRNAAGQVVGAECWNGGGSYHFRPLPESA